MLITFATSPYAHVVVCLNREPQYKIPKHYKPFFYGELPKQYGKFMATLNRFNPYRFPVNSFKGIPTFGNPYVSRRHGLLTPNPISLVAIWVVLKIMGPYGVYIIIQHLVLKGTEMGP